MTTKVAVGHYQSLEYASPTSPVLIRDEIHGDFTVTEPVLIELLHSPCLRRLVGVLQHGLSGFLAFTPPITRFEHSVGAFLIVRRAGAKLDEQIAALLHDVSHTVLSHVMDWASLTKPGESFHEVHKDRYIESTPLPDILTRHGFADLKPLQEELYPLVEMPSPHLCADRLDYGIRDTIAFGYLKLEEGRRILASIQAHPNATSPDRLLVASDQDLALALCRAYLAADRDVWSNPGHVEITRAIGDVIGKAVHSGRLLEEQMWTLSDNEFWEALREATDDAGRKVMDRLKSTTSMPHENGLHKEAKVRTLDPDVVNSPSSAAQQPVPLSQVSEIWAEEKRAYILARQSQRVA
ncbi:unnamed protein product [Clonostachys byssicola]|uniref:HD/PDEase domain-containing protein n=1 Tax=Clonostachys byssicola TaxID=160290 RepID=A0A9N9YCU5_9HYPO|nr:unnamed protein product [Clonostachys byssicola]